MSYSDRNTKILAMTVKKPLIWLGSKAFAAPFLRYVLPNYKNLIWHVPFAGGLGAMHELCPKVVKASDKVCPLINLYQQLKAGRIRSNMFLSSAPNRDEFLLMREQFNDNYLFEKTVAAAVRFWELNRYCHNGQWRVNRSGKFNVNIHTAGRAHFRPTQAQLSAWETLYTEWEFACAGFEESLTPEGKTCENVYWFDPPYSNTFDAYTAERFDSDAHKTLSDRVESLAHLGYKVIVCQTPNAQELGLYPNAKRHVFNKTHDYAKILGKTKLQLSAKASEAWFMYNLEDL